MMKRTLLWLCVLALLLSGTAGSAAINWSVKQPEESEVEALSGGVGMLFSRNGLTLEVTSVTYRPGVDLPQLRFDVWVTNDSGGTLNLHFDDVFVDGREVNGIGIYDLASGKSIPEYFYFEPLGDQSGDVLANPGEITFSVRVQFDSTGKEFFTQECRMTGPLSMDAQGAQGQQDAPSGVVGTLVDRNGIRLDVTSVSFRDGEMPLLRFDVWVENNTGRAVYISFEDAYADGTEVDGVGIYNLDPGDSTTEYFFFQPLEGESADVLRNPEALSFTLYVKDDATFEVLLSQDFYMTEPLAAGRTLPASTIRPYTYSPPRPTAAPDYPWLEKGSEGGDVRRLQLALISLGYLSGTADGVYGDQTAQAVYAFNSQNGLLTGLFDDEASPSMQEVLFGGGAQPYSEPAFSLEIFSGANAQWENVSGDRLKIHVQVRNSSKNRTVKAFELYMYSTDVWGNRIYGEDQVFYATTTKNIGPGKTAYSDYMVIADRSEIDKVYVGISKIVYTNGTVEEPLYGVEYWSWEI